MLTRIAASPSREKHRGQCGKFSPEKLAALARIIHQHTRMTLPANLPADFRAAARNFADTLRASFASGMPAQSEDQLKGPVQALLKTVTSGVLTKTEA